MDDERPEWVRDCAEAFKKVRTIIGQPGPPISAASWVIFRVGSALCREMEQGGGGRERREREKERQEAGQCSEERVQVQKRIGVFAGFRRAGCRLAGCGKR
jgi:hypothetical protein